MEEDFIPIEDAIAQCEAEGLHIHRSTMFRWAQQWAMWKPDCVVSHDDGRRWLTKDGLAEARKRLMLKAVTRWQIDMDKEKEAARKFTHRHKLYIQEAASRGERLKDIVEALGIVRPPPHRDSDP